MRITGEAGLSLRHSIVWVLVMAGLSAIASGEAAAQEAVPSGTEHAFGFSAGLGNPYGWFGGALEVFGLGGRASVRVGAGYVPKDENGGQGFVAYAASVRTYFGERGHQLTLEGSYSLLTFSSIAQGGVLLRELRRYGPGAAVGYRHTWKSGLHFDVNFGVGWSSEGQRWRPTTGVGLGYTLRRGAR